MIRCCCAKRTTWSHLTNSCRTTRRRSIEPGIARRSGRASGQATRKVLVGTGGRMIIVRLSPVSCPGSVCRGDEGCESGSWLALFRAAESSAGMFSGIAVSTNLFSAHEGHVLVMNSRMSLSLGNAFSRKPGSRARGGLKAGRPTDGRQAGRAQALEPGCEASRARQRCDRQTNRANLGPDSTFGAKKAGVPVRTKSTVCTIWFFFARIFASSSRDCQGVSAQDNRTLVL